MADWTVKAERPVSDTAATSSAPPSSEWNPTAERPIEKPAEPSFVENIGTGLLDKFYGAAQLGARAPIAPDQPLLPNGGVLPPEYAASVDKTIQEREKQIQREGGGGWGRTIGNFIGDAALTAPLGVIAPEAGVLARIGQGARLGAAGGAISGATKPATGKNFEAEKLGQIATEGTVGALGGAAMGSLSAAIARNSPAAVDNWINNVYRRSVQPSVNRKGQWSDFERYMIHAREGMDRIVEQKPNLEFIESETGEVVRGRLPQTLDEFSQAIDQTKERLFEQYNQKAAETGQAGVQVGLAPIVNELQAILGDRVTQMNAPQLQRAAERAIGRYSNQLFYTPLEAQRAIKILNQELKTFYAQGGASRDEISDAFVDSMIANQLRKGLDTAVSSVSGPGYQSLKNAYGSLKVIEKDVLNRAIVEGRKRSGGGLIGAIADIASANEVIRGVLSFHPQAMATGIGIKAMELFRRHLLDPNRAVWRLFERAEEAPRPVPFAIPTANAIQRSIPSTAGMLGDPVAQALGLY